MTLLADALISKARAEQHEQLDLGLFEHLLERMPMLMRPDQVKTVIGWSLSTIYELCGSEMLEFHVLPGREREAKRITRRSVAVLLLRTAKYKPEDFAALLALALPTMDVKQLQQLIADAQAELKRQLAKRAAQLS